jgi:hypothetical protein
MEIQFTIKLVGFGGNAASLKNMAKKDDETADGYSLSSTFTGREKPPRRSTKNPRGTGGSVGDEIGSGGSVGDEISSGGSVGDEIGSGGSGGGLAPVIVIGPIVITGAASRLDDGTGGSVGDEISS